LFTKKGPDFYIGTRSYNVPKYSLSFYTLKEERRRFYQ
jgi:hypothetical protein